MTTVTNDSSASAYDSLNFLRVVALVLLVYMLAGCSYGWMDCGPQACKAGFHRFLTETGVTLTTPNGGSFSYSSSPSDLAMQNATEALARLTALLQARQSSTTLESP
jgi:hypothetical protein